MRFIATPNNVTGFWVKQDGIGCSLYPASDVLFLSITNLQSERTLLSGYTVSVSGAALKRLDMRHSDLLFMGDIGTMDHAACTNKLDFGSPVGIGSLVHFDPNKPDVRHACSVDAKFLDTEISQNYIAPKQTVRGWVFLSRLPGIVPIEFDLTIKDATGKEFPYHVEANKGDPNADILPRTMEGKGVVDVSDCNLK